MVTPGNFYESKMVTPGIRFCVMVGFALAMVSCVAPKATVVAEAPKKKEAKVPEPVAPEPEMPALPDNEIRLPQMLDLPDDNAFRASNPQTPKVGSGGVMIRPPTDPPSRVKPPVEE